MEIRFLKKAKGCTLQDWIRNKDMRNELNGYAMNDKIIVYKESWHQFMNERGKERIGRVVILNYKPQGKEK